MNDQTQALSAQQLQAMQTRMQESLQRIISQMELRKTALDAAVQLVKATSFPGSTITYEMGPLLAELHKFLSEPAQDVKITLT